MVIFWHPQFHDILPYKGHKCDEFQMKKLVHIMVLYYVIVKYGSMST